MPKKGKGAIILDKFLNLVLPPTCAHCHKVVSEHHHLCADCWNQIHFLGSPLCSLCGTPFPYKDPHQHLCIFCCQEKKPLFSCARSAIAYDNFSKRMILHFKHGDATHLAPTFAQWLKNAGQDCFAEADALIPVPLHWTRRLKRQFNQSALLCSHLSKQVNIPLFADILKRIHATPSQGQLDRHQRSKNIQGAFRVSSHDSEKIAGKILILVDDVMTTGATLKECAKVLLENKAREVRILTLARVLHPA